MPYKESAMTRPLLLSLLCAGLLAGCAASQSAPTSSPAPCEVAYTFAPGNYIIDLASGSEVVLDPLMHDFPLFCSPAEAQNALELALANRQLPDGDWRIYRLGREADIKEINVIDRILHQITLDDVRSAIHRADAIRSAKPSSDAKTIHGAICYGNPDFSLHTFLRTVLMEVGEI